MDLSQLSASDKEDIVLTHGANGRIDANGLQCEAKLEMLLPGVGMETTTKCIESSFSKAQTGIFNNDSNLPTILSPYDNEFCNGCVIPVNNLIRVINF